MAESKTKPTQASIEDYIASRADAQQAEDCEVLMKLLHKVTKEKPVMWGPSIVGYGAYRYKYDSGRTGECCRTGFAIRGRELVLYLLSQGEEQQELLGKLGKHRMGKSCLYIKRLSDIDLRVLEKLIKQSLRDLARRYPEE